MMSKVLLEENHKTLPVLLKTKLFVPQTHELLPRPRLIQELNKGLKYRLNMVVAPAGYGKTIAVAEWARQNKLPVTWFSIDESDNDPVRFWSYLLMALEQITPGIGSKSAVVLRSIGMPQVEKVISLLIDDILGLSQEFTLVLDDFHLIKDPIIHDTFLFLLQYMPNFMHIILISRELPPFSAQMMGKGMLKELLVPKLRFTLDEITAFCRDRDLPLTWDEAIKLEARTEGWAAGLHLAALSMKDSQDILGTIDALKGNNHYLSCYLFDEVLNQWPEDEKTFLLKTSILKELCGPLCDAVTGQTGSDEVLERLAAKNAFITVLDPEGYWYRFHHLFAEFLQGRLGRENGTQRNLLHRLAGEWYERNGFLTEAVHHFIKGECYSQAVLLIQKLAPEMLEKGETEALLNWLNVLPEPWRSQNPVLCLAGAWALILTKRLDQVEYWLKKAEELSGDRREPSMSEGEQHRILGEICLARARLYHYDLKQQCALFNEACRLIPDKSIFLQAAMQPNMGMPGVLKGFFNYTKDLREIEPFFRQLMETLAMIGGQDVTGLYYVVCGELAYERNDLDEAARLVIEGIHHSEKVGEEAILVIALLTLGRIMYGRGFVIESLNALDEAGRKIRAMDALYWLPVLEASKVRLWLRTGEMEPVRKWMAANRMSIYDRLSPEREFEYITLARGLLAQGIWDKAVPLLTRLQTFTEQENRPASVIEVLNLQALVHQERDENEKALQALYKSLALAEKDEYLRTYIDEGVPMLRLLKKLGRWLNQRPRDSKVDVSTGYIKKLIKLLQKDTVPKMQSLSGRNENYSHAWRSVDPLTEKELEVLRLLALGMKNSGISTLLNISVNTVKVHTRNIYNKLMVGNRFHAVEMARELKIIE